MIPIRGPFFECAEPNEPREFFAVRNLDEDVPDSFTFTRHVYRGEFRGGTAFYVYVKPDKQGRS